MSRELNRAIAEELGISMRSGLELDTEYAFSEDGNAMLHLDAEMRERGLYLQISFDQHGCYTQYKLRSEVFMDGGSHAKEEPLARALAAYKALKGEEWQA